MCDATIREYKIHSLQNDYKLMSKIIYDQTKHIERCYINNIINIIDRNNYLKDFNNIIRQLNINYNENISKLGNEDNVYYNKEDDKLISSIIDLQNDGNIFFEQVKDIINLWKNHDITYDLKIKNAINILYSEPLQSIRLSIKEKCAIIGFYNLETAIYILTGIQMKQYIFSDNLEKIEFMNSIFIPLGYSQELRTDKYNNLDIIKSKSINDILLDNSCEIIIKHKNIQYRINGYIEYDALNVIIRTSQICNDFLYNKKLELEKKVDEIKYINNRFKKIYMKNVNIIEILTYDVISFQNKINTDYEYYTKLIKMLSFKNLMNEFLKDNTNIKNMFNMIKLLLLGTDECINFAGLLYGLTKDKKVGGELISEIIYQNLNFISQVKLKKSIINIKNEMDKIKSLTIEDVDFKKQLAACKNMPLYIKKCVSEKIEEMKAGSSEYYKQYTYIKMLLSYPWPSDDDEHNFLYDIRNDMVKSREFLDNSRKILNDTVYGHEGCKDAIQEMIAKWLSNPKASGKAIGLHGNPGIGKTLIAKALGKTLNIPFVQINLGGLDDGCVLCGHSYTYSAAQPGLIIKKMIEAGSSRCIMYFDELDKACKKHDVNEIYNILIHLTDPNTNQEFSDRFFQELNFPLDKVLFVFSYNDPSLIDRILRDRLQEIEVKPYTMNDKVIITKQFLLKEICDGIGLNKDIFEISDTVIEYFIENHTHESGVRELKRKIESLFLKLNIDKYYTKGPFTDNPNNIIITTELIDKYLKKPKHNIKKIHSVDAIGVTNGLYATTSGQGGIIPIIITNNFAGKSDHFELKITGSQGKVMTESIEYSYTTAINLVKSEYRKIFLENNKAGLHIHNPDGSTPKDGPSAGCAFTIAFLSVILNKKIKKICTLTGEIEPTGHITAIGGLQYKLIGAKKAGAKLVFVPKENEDDYKEIIEKDNKLLDENFSVMIVGNVYQVATNMLLEDDGSPLDVNKYLIDNIYA
jgi:endopeptidase La